MYQPPAGLKMLPPTPTLCVATRSNLTEILPKHNVAQYDATAKQQQKITNKATRSFRCRGQEPQKDNIYAPVQALHWTVFLNYTPCVLYSTGICATRRGLICDYRRCSAASARIITWSADVIKYLALLTIILASVSCSPSLRHSRLLLLQLPLLPLLLLPARFDRFAHCCHGPPSKLYGCDTRVVKGVERWRLQADAHLNKVLLFP